MVALDDVERNATTPHADTDRCRDAERNPGPDGAESALRWRRDPPNEDVPASPDAGTKRNWKEWTGRVRGVLWMNPAQVLEQWSSGLPKTDVTQLR